MESKAQYWLLVQGNRIVLTKETAESTEEKAYIVLDCAEQNGEMRVYGLQEVT